MEIQIGDHFTDQGQEVVTHPAATMHGGKTLRASVQRRASSDPARDDVAGARAGDHPATSAVGGVSAGVAGLRRGTDAVGRGAGRSVGHSGRGATTRMKTRRGLAR
jgi:hypothetical protein